MRASSLGSSSDAARLDDGRLPPWIVPYDLGADALPPDMNPEGSTDVLVLLLDGAQTPNLPDMVDALGLDALCLFAGKAADAFADVAPWLVRVEPAAVVALFAKSGTPWHVWGGSRFVVFRTARTLADLRDHFRGFLRYVASKPAPVDDFGGDGARGTLFRFYDAQILADWLVGTADHPDRMARLLSVDRYGQPLIEHAWLAEDPERRLLSVACGGMTTTEPGPRSMDDIDRSALAAGFDCRLIARTTESIEPTFNQLDPSRVHQTKRYVEASLDWLRYWGASPREADDLVQLSLLVYMLGDARDAVMGGPVMSERLVPTSQRIALTRDSLLSEMRRLESLEGGD